MSTTTYAERALVAPARTTVAYRLASDTWNGVSRVQLIVEHAVS